MGSLTKFMRLVAELLLKSREAKARHIAKRPRLVVRRTDDPIQAEPIGERWARSKNGLKRVKVPVYLYGLEYEDRSRYRPHIGAKQRAKAARRVA